MSAPNYMRKTRFLVAGVPDSQNLGDGLIAQCVNKVLFNLGADTVINFDFESGVVPDITLEQKSSSSYIPRQIRKRQVPKWIKMIKGGIVQTLKQRSLKIDLENAIIKSDEIIVGGGHLLIDTYLKFPLALREIGRLAAKHKKPLHIFCVGARGPWSQIASIAFSSALKYARTVTLRDRGSLEFLKTRDQNYGQKCRVLCDPAFLVSEFYFSSTRSPQNGKPIVGFGIMDPAEMDRHCELRWDRDDCSKWWCELANGLVSRGYQVKLFTNGSPRDNSFLHHFVEPKCTPCAEILKFPSKPSEVLNNINMCNSVVAQRLHACIPALALGKTVLPIAWDDKVSGIFGDLELKHLIIDYKNGPETAIQKLEDINLREDIRNAQRNLSEKIEELKCFISSEIGK